MLHPYNISACCLMAVLLFFASCNNEQDAKVFMQTLQVKADNLSIDNSRDTMITGAKGTAIFFEKESFVMPDGSAAKGNISIKLKECYSLADMMREGLSTTAGGQLLESGGMVEVRAFAGGQELELKGGKKFIVHFPKDSTASGKRMNLFYASRTETGVMEWKQDTATLLKPIAYAGWWWDSKNEHYGYFRFKGDLHKDSSGSYYYGADSFFKYWYQNFDCAKLRYPQTEIGKYYQVTCSLDDQGKTSNVKIVNGTRTLSEGLKWTSNEAAVVDPYYYQFVSALPPMEAFVYDEKDGYNKKVKETQFLFVIGTPAPAYRSKEEYNKVFNQKYSAFKNKAITSINEAELSYYIASASKLGWINCDYFWETKDEKIDYVVKIDSKARPNVKLIFKAAKSIMQGTVEGDKCIFRNIPVNQEVKIVSIAFNGSKPMLSVAQTKTGKVAYDGLVYREFALSELERELGNDFRLMIGWVIG